MTAVEMSKYIGRSGFVAYGDLKYEVTVTDVKERWGKLRFEVRPLAGFGRSWVESVEFQQQPAVSISEVLERR